VCFNTAAVAQAVGLDLLQRRMEDARRAILGVGAFGRLDLEGLEDPGSLPDHVYRLMREAVFEGLNERGRVLVDLKALEILVRGRMMFDYQRHGTVDLFAALDLAQGTVISDIRSTRNQNDFIAFLHKINREVPAPLDVHIILDNLGTHKTPKVQRWLLRHRRFHLHFTPTLGSWMNLVEQWFSALTTKKLKRSGHRSAKELAADIRAWVDTWNENPKPFVWHKTAEQILERLAGYCAALNATPA
jgi:transposase